MPDRILKKFPKISQRAAANVAAHDELNLNEAGAWKLKKAKTEDDLLDTWCAAGLKGIKSGH